MTIYTVVTLSILSTFMLAVMACGGERTPPPDIDATVEAKVRTKLTTEVTIEARVKERVAKTMPTSTPVTVTSTPRPPTSTPVTVTSTPRPPTSTPSPATFTKYASELYGFSITHPPYLSSADKEGQEYFAYGNGDYLFVTVMNNIYSNDVEDFGDSRNFDNIDGFRAINRGLVFSSPSCPCYRVDYEWVQVEETYLGTILYVLSFPEVLEIQFQTDFKDFVHVESFANTVFPMLVVNTAVTESPNVDVKTSEGTEFQYLDKSVVEDILKEVFWNSLDVLGDIKTTIKPDGQVEVTEVNYEKEVTDIFHTLFYLLMGNPIPQNIYLGMYKDEEYESLLKQSNGSPEWIAWCCIQDGSSLEMVVGGERPFPDVLASVSHEYGHAIHRTENRIFDRSGEIKALKEAVAHAYQAAIMRELGEYTGLNVIRMPDHYSSVDYFETNWISWRDSVNDFEEEHERGRVLLWLMVFHDGDFMRLREELDSNYILSPESLLLLADKLISMKRDEGIDYVSSILTKENFFESKSFVKEKITARNSTEPEVGLLEGNWSLIVTP